MASGEDLPEFRIVLDTNVAVSGLLSPQGASHAIVDLAVHHRARIRLGASEENRDELLATLREPRLATRIKSRGFTPEALYMLYVTLTEPAVPTTLWRGQWSSDPDDDAFLATAFAFSADLLVSRDSDLLNLKQTRTEDDIATAHRAPTGEGKRGGRIESQCSWIVANPCIEG